MSLTDIRLMPQVSLSFINDIPHLVLQVRLFFIMATINPTIVKTIIKISKSDISITSFSAVDWRCCHLPAERQPTAYRY